MLRTIGLAAALGVSMTGYAAATPACPASAGAAAGAFREGSVDGRWLGVVLGEVGGNGGALSATLYTLDQYGALAQLGPVRAYTAGGDRMDAFFTRDKVYLTNAVYRASDAHCCPSRIAAQRFGLHRGVAPAVALEREGAAVFAAPAIPYTPFETSCEAAAAARFARALRALLARQTYH